MSKELDEVYKRYSARITEMDDTPLVKVMDGGKFKMLSIEEYEEMTSKIADLEAKLAESEEQLNNSEQKCLICNKCQENEQLKQQLAEKDEEIKKLKSLVDMIDKYGQYDKDAKQIILINPDNVYADGHRLVVKSAHQDKISFALEQLEEVKEFCDGMKWAMVHLTKENTQTIQTVLDEINKQIKKLTHQQEDEGE